MSKRFLSNNMSGMTFVFTIVVLMHSILAAFKLINIENLHNIFIIFAILILVFALISDSLTYLNFPSEKVFHSINFVNQFSAFLLIGNLFKMIDLSVGVIVINFFIALGIYSLSVKRHRYELNKLALAINERLSN
ncbi:hypothetical protein [Marinilactibacillus psychrotolerans]|uniref:hypothetical protein n=1 Tax=Marinilactibacillus psychrotolerans TaxID=191770 RepID=UPI003889D3E4